MNMVSQAKGPAMVARPDGELQMDQRKPAAPAQAPAVDQLISRQLRALYDEVVNEPIPDRFVQLLEELERKQADKT